MAYQQEYEINRSEIQTTRTNMKKIRLKLGSISVAKNYIYNTLTVMINIAFPFFTFTYITRILGPEYLGKVNFAFSVLAYYLIFASFVHPLYALRLIATTRNSKEKMNGAFSELFVLNMLASFITMVFYFISIFFLPKIKENSQLFSVVGLQLILGSLFIDWLYQGNENYRFLSIRNLAVKLVSVALIFTLVRYSKNYLLYSAILAIGSGGANVFNIIKSKEYVRFTIRGIDIGKHLKPLGIFFAINLISISGMNLDKVVIGYIYGDIEVGYYVVADKLIQIMIAFTTSFATVLLPRISYYFSERRMIEFIQERLLKTPIF
jgi:O-antigen/teichoic acid export membrane protein